MSLTFAFFTYSTGIVPGWGNKEKNNAYGIESKLGMTVSDRNPRTKEVEAEGSQVPG